MEDYTILTVLHSEPKGAAKAVVTWNPVSYTKKPYSCEIYAAGEPICSARFSTEGAANQHGADSLRELAAHVQ